MLIAFNDEGLDCFATQGDWLYVANKKDTKKGLFKLRSYLHYFVSIDAKRMPSAYGVVKKIDGYITAEELAKLDYSSRKDKNKVSDLSEYEWFLESISKFPENTPIGISWFEKRIPKPEKHLKIHKKFFTGMSSEEKNKIFNFDYNN
jgi:hypothetical protein